MNPVLIPGVLLASLTLCTSLLAQAPKPANEEYPDFYTGGNGKAPKGIEFVQAIKVSEPAYFSQIKGDTRIAFSAPGMTQVKVFCWQQPTAQKPDPWGHDVELAPELKLDPDGKGSLVFHADEFPNGPITLRIHTKDEGKKQDICELMLYNTGGVVWNQGVPKMDPPAARGMKLAFCDDFDGPLSISPDGKDARYPAHKTGGGDFSGWPFSNPGGENKPFGQVGTFLRIHASKEPGTKGCTGIISSIRADGTGVTGTPPCYFECRFLAHSGPGTWPAFWTLTRGTLGMEKSSPEYAAIAKAGCDELDVIEAYGGWGHKNPNWADYAVTTHLWGQKDADGKQKKGGHANVPMMTLGGKSSWSWTFHTYGVLITPTETAYYFDNIEVLRHATGPVSQTQPTWFLINFAIGGISGWKIDLERYGNQSDMYVDYVRVYQGQTR